MKKMPNSPPPDDNGKTAAPATQASQQPDLHKEPSPAARPTLQDLGDPALDPTAHVLVSGDVFGDLSDAAAASVAVVSCSSACLYTFPVLIGWLLGARVWATLGVAFRRLRYPIQPFTPNLGFLSATFEFAFDNVIGLFRAVVYFAGVRWLWQHAPAWLKTSPPVSAEQALALGLVILIAIEFDHWRSGAPSPAKAYGRAIRFRFTRILGIHPYFGIGVDILRAERAGQKVMRRLAQNPLGRLCQAQIFFAIAAAGHLYMLVLLVGSINLKMAYRSPLCAACIHGRWGGPELAAKVVAADYGLIGSIPQFEECAGHLLFCPDPTALCALGAFVGFTAFFLRSYALNNLPVWQMVFVELPKTAAAFSAFSAAHGVKKALQLFILENSWGMEVGIPLDAGSALATLTFTPCDLAIAVNVLWAALTRLVIRWARRRLAASPYAVVSALLAKKWSPATTPPLYWDRPGPARNARRIDWWLKGFFVSLVACVWALAWLALSPFALPPTPPTFWGAPWSVTRGIGGG